MQGRAVGGARPAVAEERRDPERASIADVFARMGLADQTPRSPAGVVDAVRFDDDVVEDFRPLADSLEWRLSAQEWQRAGVAAFASGDVPYIVNNSGRLSEDAAALLFHNCLEAPPAEHLLVLELGAGTGLFARYFLDAFQAICQQEGRDFYERLHYVVTDRSPTTVEDWRRLAIFAPHEGRVTIALLDGTEPDVLRSIDGARMAGVSPRAVFCNYVLDVLPASIVRFAEHGAEELYVRSRLSRASQMTSADMRAVAAASTEGDAQADRWLAASRAAPFDLELAFRPATSIDPEDAVMLREHARGLPCTIYNRGALRALRTLRRDLQPGGFILLHDYGPTDAGDAARHAVAQRFGDTLSIGLDFSLLARAFDCPPWRLLAPAGDAERALHARLLLPGHLARTAGAFENRFSADAQRYFEEPAEQARQHAAAGRNGAALECYRLALARSPRDWRVITEAAEFVGLRIQDYAAGSELARAALELNPWYSSWTWNVIGDCLFCLERFAAAHEAYLEALRVSERDPRTHLNLAYTYAERGEHERALQSIAQSLGCDEAGLYRDRLLEKQQQILMAVTAHHDATQVRLATRAARFLAATAATPPPPDPAETVTSRGPT